ncbi:hemerythrin domain-containing protein [Thauera sp.]|jgi:branched-chain amino acid transport system ATP-binding protein|uniref:hemerythrin domain-containing protein n=1 Tax=Thauera sp. TaxID=1905334 RepID=UPI002637E962|nr:hemerythrin domain-containing protein [Thauera sp.]MCK6407775.1 hemerythrin domain-containing protein [Thauera sp.]
MSMKSLDVIRDEHRALAAMLSGMRTIVQGIEAGRLKPDYDLLASMIEYIDKVPEKVHHPKENEYLFAKLRLRCAAALPVIEALEEEHRLGEARIATLRAALEDYRQQGETGFAAFSDALRIYIADEWYHMNTEEGQILPLAKAHLTEEDWVEIDAAFLANDNPWQGPAGEYAALFSRIVNTAPSPVGLGG